MKVRWLCDVKGWAYEILAKRFIDNFDREKYQHQIVYVNDNWQKVKKQLEEKVDLIVCFSPRFLRFIKKEDLGKTILRLDGFRAFE